MEHKPKKKKASMLAAMFGGGAGKAVSAIKARQAALQAASKN